MEQALDANERKWKRSENSQIMKKKLQWKYKGKSSENADLGEDNNRLKSMGK